VNLVGFIFFCTASIHLWIPGIATFSIAVHNTAPHTVPIACSVAVGSRHSSSPV
jgi:hypothetical protein